MKIILLQDVTKLGQKGSVAEVADGYAQNVLIPKKMALPATAGNLKQAEDGALRSAERVAMDAALAKQALGQLDGKTVTIQAKASESGTLFEAIHEKQILEAIKKEFNIALPESALALEGPIKKVGDHSLPLSLSGSSAALTLSVTGLSSFENGAEKPH